MADEKKPEDQDMDKTTFLDSYLTVPEATQRLGISDEELLNHVAEGKLDAAMKDGQMHFKESDVKSLAAELGKSYSSGPSGEQAAAEAHDLEPTAESGTETDLDAVGEMSMEEFEQAQRQGGEQQQGAEGQEQAKPEGAREEEFELDLGEDLGDEDLVFQEEEEEPARGGTQRIERQPQEAQAQEPAPEEVAEIIEEPEPEEEALGVEAEAATEPRGLMSAEERRARVGMHPAAVAGAEVGAEEASGWWVVPLALAFIVSLIPFSLSMGVMTKDLGFLPGYISALYGGQEMSEVRESPMYDPLGWGRKSAEEAPAGEEPAAGGPEATEGEGETPGEPAESSPATEF